ncbi:hypothetical protein BD779DRAFT_1774733 [Infundibulicybe gibba]|nr:hypothetical protein BD779DRAFT_1774733 [Infundibulicybe gibba]
MAFADSLVEFMTPIQVYDSLTMLVLIRYLVSSTKSSIESLWKRRIEILITPVTVPFSGSKYDAMGAGGMEEMSQALGPQGPLFPGENLRLMSPLVQDNSQWGRGGVKHNFRSISKRLRMVCISLKVTQRKYDNSHRESAIAIHVSTWDRQSFQSALKKLRGPGRETRWGELWSSGHSGRKMEIVGDWGKIGGKQQSTTHTCSRLALGDENTYPVRRVDGTVRIPRFLILDNCVTISDDTNTITKKKSQLGRQKL